MATPESRISKILKAHEAIYFCDGCLALRASLSLQESQEILGRLDGRANFHVTLAKCAVCLREKMVACASRDQVRRRGMIGGASIKG